MRKSFRFSFVTRSLSAAVLFATLGACSDKAAPLAPFAAQHSAAASRRVQDEALIPVFVIGDGRPNAVGDTVNFWGAQWWKNNQMTDTVTAGVASFKGYATTLNQICGGTWESRPGNSYDPPSAIDDDVLVIVTSRVIKEGAAIRGDIKRVVKVRHDGGYGPNPGHDGNGVVTSVVCGNGGGGGVIDF